VLAAVVGGLAVWVTGRGTGAPVKETARRDAGNSTTSRKNSLLPKEIRGIHVSSPEASLPGKLGEFAALKDEGLNTIELDIKDENGTVAFSSPEVPLASEINAAGNYYDPSTVAKELHADGIYLIGRVVVFEDPVLADKRPDLAIQRSDGSPWLDSSGIGWTNEYNHDVWKYNVSIAKVAAKAGFDEIQFDYARFPSDAESAVWPGQNGSKAAAINRFLRYAVAQLKPLGVRVSVDVFGLAATHELGVGQEPAQMAKIVDEISPMVYPSHFGAWQYGLPNPQAAPGMTVIYALEDFSAAMRGTHADLLPWIQDFSMGRKFTLSDIQDEILSVRRSATSGYLLWNPTCEYTPGALKPS
jgi:hypothetical protein